MTQTPGSSLEIVFREESGRILAGLLGRFGGDFDLAEEALQEACAEALEHWPRTGAPHNPGAWLATTAQRKVLDRLRRERLRRGAAPAAEPAAAETAEQVELALDSSLPDDRLRLIFTCCHPALALEAQVALTLRTLGGLNTAEIAHAFLVPEPTMAQRLVRAQRKIRDAGIPYRVPHAGELHERLDGVLAVLYLIFNEGYSASSGASLLRVDLCREALRLARILSQLLPQEPEVWGLLALLLLQDSRRAARLDAAGGFVPLDRQDRGLWDWAAIDEGLSCLEKACAAGPVARYGLQAAIAAEHARAPRAAATDWPRIVLFYDALVECDPSPVVRLNRAAALAKAYGPERGLQEVEHLLQFAAGALDRYPWLHSLRGELLARLERRPEAAAALRRAAELARTEPERRWLAERLAAL